MIKLGYTTEKNLNVLTFKSKIIKMNQLYSTKKLDINNISDTLSREIIQFRKTYFNQYIYNTGTLNHEKWLKWMLNNIKEIPSYNFYNIFKQEKIIANFWYYINNSFTKENKMLIRFQHDLNQESEQLASIICNMINKLKSESGKIIIESKEVFFTQIGEKCDFRKSNSKEFFTINTTDLDINQLNSWLEFLPDKFSYNITEELNSLEINEVTKIMNILLNDMKRKDHHTQYELTPSKLKENITNAKKNGIKHIYILLNNEKNQLIGYAFLTYQNKFPKIGSQHMTGILENYRRKGLAKLLKSLMYFEILKNSPAIEIIKTDSFLENNKIKNLNLKIGFKKEFTETELYYINNENKLQAA